MKIWMPVLSLVVLVAQVNASVKEAPIALAIHGGAGTINKQTITETQAKAIRQALNTALSRGHSVLSEGGSSLDAVTRAVQSLEASPLFNAGKGAVYTYDGSHELDAAIMDGRTLAAGAVAGVRKVQSPIALAREVMLHSNHVMLSGAGADRFARKQGLMMVDNSYFDTPHRYSQWQKARVKLDKMDLSYVPVNMQAYKFGTVGAVALDKQGNLAAATSTGGMTAKRYGRIGDSPIIGAGTYANNASCAVSATGHGEYFIRYQVAADICARVKYQNASIQHAAHGLIMGELKAAGGDGGVIAMDANGEIAMPFNTQGMYRASIDTRGRVTVALYGE